jgi:hydroxylamine reductase (hybrid-cluster protein)
MDNMFCMQCEQTAGGKACTSAGVCGKTADTARLQDELTGALIMAAKNGSVIDEGILLKGLFATLTNVNFDDAALQKMISRIAQPVYDTIILTLGCGKYRFNDLDLGEIGGLPRIMDMGQCNDSYSAVKVALALSDAFGCGVNELPLTLVLSWYEQKAVSVLLTLLYLGIKNIRLGPSLPAFVSPNVLNYLVENFSIKPVGAPKADLAEMLG